MDAPDSLSRDAVEPLLTGGFGRPYLYEERCESTQQLLTADLPEGAVAACEFQAAGRGRLGRSWEAAPGTSLLASVLLRPPPGRNPAELSLVGGLAAAETAELALQLAAQVKWPNDVMVNRRKIAGVLAERFGDAVVLGIGMNVNQTREELPLDSVVPAGSFRTTDGKIHERAPLLASLLALLERSYALWREHGLDGIYDGLGARDFLRGRRITVDGRAGEGVLIDRRGRLEVEIDGHRETIESGEVLFER